MTAIDTVTARLYEVTGYQALRVGAEWRCPAHDDHTPSLSVSNGNGKVLLFCQAGCSLEAVLDSLRLDKADLFDEPLQRQDRGRVDDRYDYVDEGGQLLFRVVRKEMGNGRKQFHQCRPDGNGGWMWKLGDTRRVLYRLPRVKQAIVDGRGIFIAEGEKDVHALEAAGEVATCNPMGAGSWKPEYTEMLAGAAEIIIVADKDETGRNHARDIERSFKGRVDAVRTVEAKVGKDAFDHFAAGHTVDEFTEVADGQFVPEVSEAVATHFATRQVVGRLAADIVPKPVRWAYANRVPLGSVTLLVGREGVGKGVCSANMMARWSRGQLPGDLRGTPVNVAVLSLEDSAEHVLVPRLTAAGADRQRVHVIHVEENGAVTSLEFPGDITALGAWLVAKEIKVLGVDVATAFLTGDHDSHKDHDVRRGFMTPLGILAERLDIAVVINHHLNRAPSTLVLDRIAGSLGVSRAARAVLAVVENPEEASERVLVMAKSNLGVLEVPAIRFRIEGAEVETPTGMTNTGRYVELGETASVSAHNALKGRDDVEETTAVGEAADWLADLLGAGPVPATEVKSAATRAGIAWATVRRGKDQVGIKSKRWGRPGEEGGWCWALTSQPEGAHENPKVSTSNTRAPSTFGEHLHDDDQDDYQDNEEEGIC